MSLRTDTDYKRMGIPNQSPFDWRVEPEPLTRAQIYAKQKYQKKIAGRTPAETLKAQITRKNKTVDLSAHSSSKSERASR